MPKKGYKRPPRSIEWSEKISQSNRGRKVSEITREKISEANKGRKLTKEHREKLGKAHKGKKLTEETKRKISKNNARYWLGKQFSQEYKAKISKALKGLKRSEAIKKRMSQANSKEKHWNWQGGISFEPYSIDWTQTLRRAIRERDNYICRLCSQYGNLVHHIDYNKKNCNSDNLITLCRGCNSKVNFNRGYWTKHFLKLTNNNLL